MAPFAPFTIDEISKVFEEELDAALENEGGEDVGAARVVEVVEEEREQGVLVTSSTDKGRCVGGRQGEWGGVGNAVRARIRWHEVAGPCGNDVLRAIASALRSSACSSREASNHVTTCILVIMRAWPSLTGKASQRPNTRSPR